MLKLLSFFFLLCSASQAWALNSMGRLGVGITNHLGSDLQAISVKVQKARSLAIGGHFAVKASADTSLYALGGKLYRNIYEEPQLNFYGVMEATLLTYETQSEEVRQGYLLGAGFGSEFSLQGLESLGLSFEFGMALSKTSDDSQLETTGNHIIKSAVHFYL